MKIAMMTAACLLAIGTANAQETSAADDGEKREAYVPAQISNETRAIVRGLNDFGLSLYAKLSTAPGDLTISPASISTAFGLAYAGARGDTAKEIASVLHYPTGGGDFHKAFGALLGMMQLDANGRTIAVNNAIWLQTGLKVNGDYLALIERNYGAGLRRVDYIADPDTARLSINRWVEEKTNDRILDLLGTNDVTDKTRSVLVNTIYFKSDWDSPFHKQETKEGDFRLASGRKATLQLMKQRQSFRYAEQGDLQFLALPYRGGETEMVILLPGRPSGLAALEQSLNPEAWRAWSTQLRNGQLSDVIVSLPRFRIEKRYDLKESLRSLGLIAPIENADFSAMKPAGLPIDGPENWSFAIGKVIHKIFVEVEEKGTEAAAATAIVMDVLVSGRRGPAPKPKIFNADHPFLFAIRDTRTDAILFLGRFTGESVAKP